MNFGIVAIVVLCLHSSFGKHQDGLNEDIECVCIDKRNRKLSIQMKISDSEKACKDSTLKSQQRPMDCKEAFDNGHRSNGVYKIYPKGYIHGYKVYCDMTTDGGGWTVFQKRYDGHVNFFRTWEEYRNGFGSVNGEYWLGNEKIHKLTTQSNQVLRIDMMDGSGTWKYATYTDFSISSNKTAYKLSFNTYKGNAGDSLAYHKGQEFKTKDKSDKHQCATMFIGAWWYGSGCHHSNLNGNYGNKNHGKGLNWNAWRGFRYSLKRTEMKLRRKH